MSSARRFSHPESFSIWAAKDKSVSSSPGRLDAERQVAIAAPLYDAARRARIVDRTLPLAGVPFALKVLGIGLKGVPIHGGSR